MFPREAVHLLPKLLNFMWAKEKLTKKYFKFKIYVGVRNAGCKSNIRSYKGKSNMPIIYCCLKKKKG